MTAAIAEEIHAGRLLTISDANAKKLAALPAKTIHALIGAAPRQNHASTGKTNLPATLP